MNESLAHFVSDEPFDPHGPQTLSAEQERFYMASQWRMMWWRLKRHKLAVVSGSILAVMYLSILITEFLAPYDLGTRHTDFIFAPPQAIHFIHEGKFEGPFVYAHKYRLNMENLKREYTPDTAKLQHLRFFCRGDRYSFMNLFEASLHLVCPAKEGTFFAFGTDRLGRDILSRILYGARISLTIGLVGICLSFAIGLTVGGLAGYFGGWVDNLAQRAIEILRSLPELPLWMGLSAALPITWSPLAVFFGLTLILALLDWPGLARAVRSKLLALREEDFCTAATLLGARPRLRILPPWQSVRQAAPFPWRLRPGTLRPRRPASHRPAWQARSPSGSW